MKRKCPGVYYNTAAVIDADGRYLGKYRKHHIPHCHPASGKSSISLRQLGYPVFETSSRASASTSATTGTFPKARASWDSMARRSSSIPRPLWPACRVSVGARAAGARRRQRLLRGRHQSRGDGKALEHRRVLRQELLLQSARQDHRASQPRQGRSCCRRSGSRHDRGSSEGLAIFPRPPPGNLRFADVTGRIVAAAD